MSRAWLSCWTFAGLLVLGLFAPIRVDAAEPPPASDIRAAARAAANHGLKLYQAGQHREAIASFREAEALFHAPTIVIMIARAYEKLGLLLDARAAYQEAIGEQLVHYAPPEFFKAQEDAKRELEALAQRIPTLAVVARRAPAELQVTIDGVPARPDEPVPQNPGEHTVAAVAGEEIVVQRSVRLREGEAARVELEIPAPTPPPVQRPSSPLPRSRPASRPDVPFKAGAPRLVVPAIAAFSIAGLAIGVGTVTGIACLNNVATMKKICPGRTCYEDASDPYDAAYAFGTASTVSFAVAAGAGVIGAALLLWPAGSEKSAQTGVAVGPGWAGLRGTF